MSDKDTFEQIDETSAESEAPREGETADGPEPDAEARTRPRITPIRIAIAVAAIAAAYTCVDTARQAVASPKVDFAVLEGPASIDEGIEAAKVMDALVLLTTGDGRIDILYAGAPECIHCNNFVNGTFGDYPENVDFQPTSFDDLVSEAEDRGLDFAYMPLAFSQIGAVLATGESCAAEASTLSAPARIKASYGMTEMLSDTGQEALEMMQAGGDPKEVQAMMVAALEKMHDTLAPGAEFDTACYDSMSTETLESMKSFSETFGQHGTPSFFFMGEGGKLLQFSGAGGIAPMLKQVVK